MRGKDCTDSDTGADTGITPAYAGKRLFSMPRPDRQ